LRKSARRTANIGIHHVHHLCGRIPYYRLPQVLRDRPRTAGCEPADAAAELRLRAPRAVGRDPAAAGVVPRQSRAGVKASPREIEA